MQLKPSAGLNGILTVPGDKSISHRAVMFGALSHGTTHISGFLSGEDCLSTIDCFSKMGIAVTQNGSEVTVQGAGLRGLKAPSDALYTGNSGTTTRLLCGILAGQAFETTLSGDASIAKRPMGRVIRPLREMGACISGREDNFCPLHLSPARLHGIEYAMPVASAQLKSAILLAALYAEGKMTVTEPAPSRDHTERMLRALGCTVTSAGCTVTLTPPDELAACDVAVPGDISSAAFFLVAGAITKNSCITLKNVGVNPTRTGIIEVLRAMGAKLSLENQRGTVEPTCDITVSTSNLRGTKIGGDLIPRLIDELPVLAVAAAFAEGDTVICDAEELRVKESNRIDTMVKELTRAGVAVEATADGMVIHGGKMPHGAEFESYGDHRIAMSLAVLAKAAEGESRIKNPEVVAISYPDFFATLSALEG